MARAVLVLNNQTIRDKATLWIAKVSDGTRVEFKAPKRSLPQNDKMWAMLSEISQQVKWHGLHLTPDDWKLVFLDALKREVRMVPNIDGNGFVNLGRSSSDLSKEEMSDLFELIGMFAANHDVDLGDL